MRIAYLHYLYGQDTALNHVRQFTAAARGLGHQVDVHAMNLARDDRADPEPPLASRLRRALKDRASRYLHEPKELLWNLRYVRKEQRLLRWAAPDVLLVRDHLLTASCIPVARRLRLPLVLEVNAPVDESHLYLDQYLHLPWFPERLERWKVRHADAVTAVSSSLKQHLIDRYGIAADRVTVVPNGADLHLFRPGCPADPAVRWAVGDGPVVGFVGSFQKWHGTDLLARLITEVAAARPAVRFLLIGSGPEVDTLRHLTSAVGDRVIFTGHVPHARIPGLVANLDIGVLPEADFFRCPLKVIEWMAAGKAVVVPRYAPLQDLIDDGVHGMLFPPRDAQALIGTVLRLVDEPELRQALGAGAAARARASLSWRDNARRVLTACDAAVQHQRTNLAHAA
jgi:glycosyltransferase involved in cell wall biosynthesis